ncbi:MAG: type I DNA topoisomerase [Planctomycetes bacterium]|nr:type I DNA topoisomerase [Planctomycetota bacterium]
MPKALVIVESPAKARTLARFLGDGYHVEASIGHIRDLPESASEIPAKYKKEPWARLGVNIENDFEPLYVVPSSKKDQIKKLKALLADSDSLYLATDEDREGESISWHLKEVLRPNVPYKRLVFHEITKKAIHDALDAVRDIDEDLVRAQETRRILDRLYGYEVSPLLWKKVKPRLSAGRVQSVAVRLIVERERARMAFRKATFWDLVGSFSAPQDPDAKPFDATLTKVSGRRIATGKDFEPTTGKLKEVDGQAPVLLDEKAARDLLARIENAEPSVASVEEKPFTERPQAPFTTSTLQQEANRRLRYSARRTMDLAQRLYENGFITYMRTDSTTLSEEALRNAREVISQRFGKDSLPDAPRSYKSKVKNAQEAHEAIRPAGAQGFTDTDVVAKSLGTDAGRLYDLIWRRTVASQMKDAKGTRVSVEIQVDDATFQVGGKVIEFPGFLAAYDRHAAADSGDEAEKRLPKMRPGDALKLLGLDAKDHTTQPPARLTEASLVRELEARGIGRPSTYASIIETILRREYVRKLGNALCPTWTAFAVTKLMEGWLTDLVDYGFTASMEDDLDKISLGEIDNKDYLERFYNGNGSLGLRSKLASVVEKIDPREVCGITLGEHDGTIVEVRVGRYGPFLSMGDVRASIADDIAPDELTLEKAIDLLQKAEAGPRVIGNEPDSGLPVYAKTGRFGPYVQLGDMIEGEDKPKMASLLAGMEIETITLDEALGLLSLPRLLGKQPGTDADVFANNGRYGPYVYAEKETRSLPAELSPLRVTLDEALKLLAQPKQRRGRTAARREPLKVCGKHPESGDEIKLLEGRFGPYVTDGTTHASLPRGTSVDEVTLDLALELIAARAAAGPKKKKKKAKKAASKKAGTKASAKSSTAKKTTAKKKAPAKKKSGSSKKKPSA